MIYSVFVDFLGGCSRYYIIVIIDEPTLADHYHLTSIVYVHIHSSKGHFYAVLGASFSAAPCSLVPCSLNPSGLRKSLNSDLLPALNEPVSLRLTLFSCTKVWEIPSGISLGACEPCLHHVPSIQDLCCCPVATNPFENSSEIHRKLQR